MKPFREERNTMHTKRAGRWVGSIAVLTATALGLGAPLAMPAGAAGAESLSASAAQPRYPVGQNAVINVTATNPVVGDSLSLSVVSGPDHAGTTSSCTTISASGTATCQLTNTGGAGTDQVVVFDANQGVSSSPTPVSFETLTATANQNVLTPGPLYLYGTSETATITATFTGAATTPALKALVTSGPDQGLLFPCSQSTTQPANWTCGLTNGGNAGADAVQLFDDDSAAGTTNQADTDEAKTNILINFEGLKATPLLPRVNTSPAGSAAFDVKLTGRPAAWTPNLVEKITNGQFSSVPSPACTSQDPPTNSDYHCSIVNNGRADTVTVQIFDDLNNNGAASATEPQDSATANFEVLTPTDTNKPHSGGSTATVSVSVAGTPAGQTPSIDYVVRAGDPDATATAQICPQATATTFTCSLKNGTTQGTDRMTIFDDANNNGVLDPGEPVTSIDVAFGDNVTATPRATNFPTKDANNAGSGFAPIDVKVTTDGVHSPNVRYVVQSGPDTAAASKPCDATGDQTVWVCNVANGGTAGTDKVLVFNDTDGDGTFDAPAPPAPGEPAATPVNVTFSVPASIALTPKLAPGQGAGQIAAGGCQPYTLTVNPGVKFPVRITATQQLGTGGSAPPAALSTCNVPGGSAVTPGHPSTNPSGGSAGFPPIVAGSQWTDTLWIDASTNQDPAHPNQVTFGISSTHTGQVTVHAATTLTANNVTTPNQTLNVVTPGAPSKVSVTPTTATIAAGGSQQFSVLVQDSSGTPLPGAGVSYVVTAGDPDATSKAVACPNADQLGTAKCTVTNNRNVGTDHVTFFAPQTSGETAPAANDPQTTATLTVNALPPAGSHLTFGCPDELLTDANQIVPACTVSTGSGAQRSIIFAAHVADGSGAAVANIPVTFQMTGSPSGSTTSATQVNTNAKGNALFVVTVPSPAAGNQITVKATVGDPANGGLGPSTAVATFQAPKPSVVSVTPSSQRVSPGGQVSLVAKVTDQFGAGLSGRAIDWAVSGRNSNSGTATTGSNGTASFSYVDTGSSGSDSVSVLDVGPNAPTGAGSNNPASAVVTFGSGGPGPCQVNCGGTGQKERPTLAAHQKRSGHKVKIKLTVTSHPKLVDAKVVFYQLSKSGSRHKIGTVATNRRGKAIGTLKASHGLHLRFQAKVKGRAGVHSGYSNVVKVHVH
ncbi:MAG TPA: hypothetical protein VHD81_06085 [Mycobacteriales bacterium]|nr:hypothetical protein [Mycobacteriales bacterium]